LQAPGWRYLRVKKGGRTEKSFITFGENRRKKKGLSIRTDREKEIKKKRVGGLERNQRGKDIEFGEGKCHLGRGGVELRGNMAG